jgi:hypothetical protein
MIVVTLVAIVPGLANKELKRRWSKFWRCNAFKSRTYI